MSEVKKYYAYIKGRDLLYDSEEATQWVLINEGMSSQYIGLREPDIYNPLTKEEWENNGITDDNADFEPEKG